MVDSGLVKKILEQGQKLRVSMIESILKHDPFNTDIIYNKNFNTPQSSRTNLSKSKTLAFGDHSSCSAIDEKRLDAFIRGECMTKEEEQLALDTLWSLSAPELCCTTARSLKSQIEPCHCTTCEIYNSYLNSNYKQRRNINLNHNITIDTLHVQQNHNLQLLEYVDSLKLSINNFKLTERGIQKVLTDCKDNVSFLNVSFFLEYQMPKQIISGNILNKSSSQNYIRLCSKLCNNSVSFKHISIHDIKNLATTNLDEINIEFKVCYRCPKQKASFMLGNTKFNFGLFSDSKGLTCYRSLSVVSNRKTPIIIGTLKLSVQLGCDRLYFGQDFIDAINSSQLEDGILSENGATSNSLTTKVPPLDFSKPKLKKVNTERKSARLENCATQTNDSIVESQGKTCLTKDTQTYSGPVSGSDHIITNEYTKLTRNHFRPVTIEDSQVLLGFIHISEAQYSGQPINTYLICQLFTEKEISTNSPVVLKSSSPVYNFSQLVPILLNSEQLYSFRENFMLIEFWKLEERRRSLIGLAEISLHQFYLAYKNPLISEHLLKRELPVIGTDGWEPIYSPNKDEVIGQVEILTALGSEEQIYKLKSIRGFSSFKPKLPSFSHETKRELEPLSSESSTLGVSHRREKLRNQEEPLFLGRKDSGKYSDIKISQSSRIEERSNISNFSSRAQEASQDLKLGNSTDKVTKKRSTTDVGTQSDMEGEKDNLPTTQDMFGSFLNQLIQQRQKNVCVENSTNTEPLHIEVDSSVTVEAARQTTNVELKRTSDLLDMLQNTLTTDSKGRKEKATCSGQARFNATVSILSANHLPSWKKYKPKKSKNRSSKSEDTLPSCYVTFETLIDPELYTTPVISKSRSPVWNYTRDVTLSADLLTNGQKRLIFKVWRKSMNATCPNMQTDVVLGFAAVDLSVLLAGFPNIQGWFNIMDFSGKCNGQINIHITPLEDLSKYHSNANSPKEMITDNTVQPSNQQEPSEMLSRALKRKFVELDEITQRLRLRLSKVTNESDSSSDDMTEEFEKDINTLCIEDDFDTINFEEETTKMQNAEKTEKKLDHSGISLLMKDQGDEGASSCCDLMSCSENALVNSVDLASIVPLNKTDDSVRNKYSKQSMDKEITEKEAPQSKHPLDKQLQEGKQHINSLLEKLTLLSSGTLTSRYVSGCSTSGSNLDTEAILEELDHSSRPNIQSSLGFDPLKFQQLYGDSVLSSHSAQTSSSSLITEFSGNRAAPDGEGGSSDSVSISTVLNKD